MQVYGQKKLDSLMQVLPGKTGADRYSVLTQLASIYLYTDADKALAYSGEAYKIAVELNDEKKIASSHYLMGYGYYRLENYQAALKEFNISKDISLKLKDELAVAEAKNMTALVYLSMKRFDLALDLFNQLLAFYNEKAMLKNYSLVLLNISNIFLEKKDYGKALEGYFKALEINIKINSNDKDLNATLYCNIGEAYYWEKQYDLSFKYRKMSLDIYKEMNFIDGVANLQMDTGLSLMKLKDYVQARQYLTKALENYKSIKFSEGIRKTLENFTTLYKETNQLDLALTTCSELEKLCIAGKDSAMLAKNYLLYAEIFFAQSSYKPSAEYYREYINLKEAIESKENTQRLLELQTAFRTEEKEFENKTLRQENELQKEKLNSKENLLLAVSVGVVIVSMLFFILFLKEKKIRKINDNIQIQNRNLEEHIVSKDKFFSILAHNLKNPFWAVLGQNKLLEDEYSELTDTERKELISRIGNSARNVYKLFEDLLKWAKTQQNAVAVEKENCNLKNLILSSALPYQMIAENKKIKLDIAVEEYIELSVDKFMMETVIGNLIDNAIKFSLQDEKIFVRGVQTGTGVEISIEDHGMGISVEKLDRLFKIDEDVSSTGTMNEKGTGLGLIICKEFVEAHNGILSVESREGKGTTFKIILPQI